MVRVPLLAVVVALCVPSVDAGAGTARGAGASSPVAAHQVRIGPSKRRVVLGPRHRNLPRIRALAGDRRDIEAGLVIYRAVRLRIRELRAQLGGVARVAPVVKTESFVLDRIDLRVAPKRGASTKPRVLIVGGVHSGSEPVGVEAALQFAESMVADRSLLQHYDITVVPLVNPSGLLRTPPTRSDNGNAGRRTVAGVDINRSFEPGKFTPESKAMAALLRHEKFDVVLDLHGAGSFRTGFFMIRGVDDRGMAARVMRDIGGRPVLDARGAGATYALDAPGVVTSANPGTLKQFAIESGARYSYTLEAPSRFSPAEQVRGTLEIVRSALRNIRDHGQLHR